MMCLLCLQMLGQQKLRGLCKDESTNQFVSGVTVQLMTPDSLVLCKTTTASMLGQFVLNVDTTGNFFLQFTHKEYETLCSWVTLPVEDANRVPVYKLSPKAKVMEEVVVNALQHDVTMRKDTLVYNAEAFVVPNGYSLRALLSQFPGLEITSDGKIKYNGRDVNYFLINGKEYMMNQPQVALDNLPAEYIDTVRIYGYTTPYERLAKDSTLEKPLAIDLSVKKEHRGQWMLNAGLSGGLKGYYRVRGFATKMLPTLEATAYGSSNNYMHRSDYYGANMWSDEDSRVGHGHDAPLGINLRWENGKSRSEKGWLELGTKVDFSNYVVSSTLASEILRFYEGQPDVTETGSLTERIRSNSANVSFRLRWNSTENTHLEYNGSISLEKEHGSVNEDNTQVSETDSTSARIHLEEYKSYDLRKVSIKNSMYYHIGYKKQGRVTSLNVSSEVKLPQDRVADGVQTLSLYQSSAFPAISERLIRLDDRQGTSCSFSEALSHSEPLGRGWSLDLKQKWNCSNEEQTNDYLVNSILDEENSYLSRRHWSELRLTPAIRYSKGGWRLTTSVDVGGDFSTLQHRQGVIDTLVNRNDKFRLNYEAKGFYKFSDRHDISLSYSRSCTRPSLLSLLPTIDTRNPLNVYINNSQQNDNYANRLNAVWSRFLPKREVDMNLESRLTIHGNKTLHTTWFDPETGITTGSSIDVDGMWNLSNTMRYNMRIGKKGRVRLNSNIGLNYTHSKNALVCMPVENPSSIRGWELPLYAGLRYTCKPKGLSLGTSFRMNQYWGCRNLGDPIVHSSIYTLGKSLTCRLPWKIDMVTDVVFWWKNTLQSHTVNKFRTMANLNLSRSFLKNNALTVKLECHDIFNARDQWETSTNPNWVSSLYTEMITNYFMLHLYYQVTL